VFIVTYYHIGTGYLYAITYYYSMVDNLLGKHLYLSQGLFTIVSIMSSIAKVRPQFLGQLCLVTTMSGIDQQFIHYVHPIAVAIIVVVICVSARVSYRLSSFVSRGIMHVIYFLLLLTYTSVAETSVLLLRSLTLIILIRFTLTCHLTWSIFMIVIYHTLSNIVYTTYCSWSATFASIGAISLPKY